MRSNRLLQATLLTALSTAAHAQDYLMGQAAIAACSGVFHDSGGPGATYANNEDLTSTICGATAGQVVSLAFNVFNLSATGPAPIDRLYIHDGLSVLAPLLGEYTQQQLNGLVVTATSQNSTGCLTLRFTSNGAGTGDFAATILCNAPCSPPVPSFTSMSDTLVVCLGSSVPVDASASFSTGAQGLAEWTWQSSAPGMNVAQHAALDTLTFVQSGVHAVRLQVTDSSGCSSALTMALTVVVRPGATFSGTAATPSPACLNDVLALHGAAELDSLHLFIDAATSYPNGIAIPDNVGVPLHSMIEVDWYPPGALLTDPAQLGGICVSMEHSFMGDLVISLACPNGSTVTLHSQGGGGTYIGGANDTPNGTNGNFGTCWEYCWTADAPNGTFAQCSAIGATPNVIIGGTPPASALAPGDYRPVQPLTNLVGCPFNGTWTLTVVDLFSFDDGSICSWSLGLESFMDTSFLSYSAHLNLAHPDSAYWMGPGVQASSMPSLASANPGAPGQHAYTFRVIDSQGCTHDTTVTAVVLEPALLVDAGADATLCSGPETLTGSAQVTSAIPCIYKLVLLDALGTGWTGGAQVAADIAGTTTVHALLSTGVTSDTIPLAVLGGQSITLTYTAGTVSNNENSFKLFNAEELLLYQSPQGPPTGTAFVGVAACESDPADLQIAWSPSVGLSSPGNLITQIAPPSTGWYTLTVSVPWSPCPVRDSVLVTGGGTVSTMTLSPSGDALCIEPATFIAYHWFLAGEPYATTTINCLPDPPFGIWTAIAESSEGCDGFPETVENCPLIIISYDNLMLSVQPGLGTYAWSYNGEPVGGSGATLNVVGLGTYTVTCTMEGGCVVTASYDVDTMGGIAESMHGHGAPVRVVPNPNTGAFVLVLPEDVHGWVGITLLDLAGRVVSDMRLNVHPAAGIPWSVNAAPGAYHVRLSDGATAHWGRLIIE